MIVKFTNVKTGEVIEVNLFDWDTYVEHMTLEDYLLTI